MVLNKSYLFTASLSALPALKAGELLAGMVIALPVRGSRPARSSRLRTSKLPNPTS